MVVKTSKEETGCADSESRANRVRFEPDRLEDIADSITRDNIRSL